MPVNRVRRAPHAQAIAEPVVLEAFSLLEGIEQAGNEPGMLEMIPIYSISARSIVLGRWDRGWRSGWRYFWTHPGLDAGITVEVRRGRGNTASLASVSVGSAAIALHQELHRATNQLSTDSARYRPRILRMPWIGMEAIWFNTDPLSVPDLFVNRAGEPNGDAFRAESVRRANQILDKYRDQRRSHM